MARINLLPWREELRAKRNKDFGITAGIVAVVVGAAIFGVNQFYKEQIAFQGKRNAFLEQQISALDKKIAEIQEIEKKREQLLRRKEKIEELQSGRPDIVHMMDELIAALPEGVYYSEIIQSGNALAVKGVAQSNARVSSLMRKIDASEWLQSPALNEIKAVQKEGVEVKLSEFSLRFSQKKRKKEETEGEGSG